MKKQTKTVSKQKAPPGSRKARKATAPEAGAPEAGASEAGAPEAGASEAGASEAGASEIEAEEHATTTGVAFPVVGIGASAGGLEALEQFLSHVPDNSGMAFVVVQHLDPTRKGIMTELLQRATHMKVIQPKNRTQVEPNRVYVIPPNKDMSILHGMLYLFDPVTPRGLRLPIDFFFRSLAEDQQERSVGVILSGMGSDGMLGARAIKEKAGVVLVQDPAAAKFDGMPRSAIDAGLADLIAPAEDIPGKILAYYRHAPLIARIEMPLENRVQSSLEKIIILLRTQTGNDFTLYKKNTLYRRIERRMGIHQIDRISTYVRYVQENPQELNILFKELLIGVTNFFRDPDIWAQLKEQAITPLLAGSANGQSLRAWVPGCSTGEEAYSLAIAFKEALDTATLGRNCSLQIFATDLDQDAIDKARLGTYPANIAADVSPERLARFFAAEDGNYRVTKEIREMVVFAQQNLIMDPPFTKLDILSCRNLLIYLAPELQKKLIPLFHYSLMPGGVLLLGSAESIGGFADLFTPLEGKSRIYRKSDLPVPMDQAGTVEFPTTFYAPSSEGKDSRRSMKPQVSLQMLADQVLLQQFTPPSVLVNENGDILYVNGRTGRYLEPATGKANWNVLVMAREGLRYELTRNFHKATHQKEPLVLRGVLVKTNGSEHAVDVTLQMIDEPEALRRTMMIVFAEAADAADSKAKARARYNRNPRLADLEHELQQMREELQTTREEMQTSQEELRSSNEELQSTNEELQSTNEELTTSKEEMQSLNEELQTVNAELQAKVDDLSRANSDMKNLLNSTDIATVFLDNDLNVRRFTTQATRIIKLITGDIGRPITDLASNLAYPNLTEDAREVLRTLVYSEKDVASLDNHWFAVRIMPYRTLENRIDGLVITFTDITDRKLTEHQLMANEGFLDAVSKASRTGGWELDLRTKTMAWSRETYHIHDLPAGQEISQAQAAALCDAGDRPAWDAALQRAAESGEPFDLVFRIVTAAGQLRRVRMTGAPVILNGKTIRIAGIVQDMTGGSPAVAGG